MAVKVQFQIGHTSKLRSKKTVEGFTHDWELYVKGALQADISAFVEKIIFNLHESFQKPKRICNKPPYIIQESGYAGFIVFIDIYFRNRDEPKKVQFSYDLDLQTTGPPQHRHDIKTFIFDNPSEEYRQKLLKGGGVPVSGVVAGSQPTINNNITAMPATVSLSHSPNDGQKPISGDGKKHKLRPDDARSNSFTNLFGPPITKTSINVPTTATKLSPDNKSAVGVAHVNHQTSASQSVPALKEKSSKEKDKSSEKYKERSEKREKHHKQSLTSPNKDGRSDSKKSDGSKHEKRDKTEEKYKKDKNRDKDKERDREKSSSTSFNSSGGNNKRPSSPKPGREHSPHKPTTVGTIPTNVVFNNTNSVPRPLSSNSGKLDEIKPSSKPSKESSGEIKSKDAKQKESSSSSKKSKREKKDKDKERDKEKRHEDREKQKMAESQQRSNAKEDGSKVNNNNLIAHANSSANSLENKNSKLTSNLLNTNTVANDVGKKFEKVSKQDFFKMINEKITASSNLLPSSTPATNNSSHSSNEKKAPSSSSLNSNSNPIEKDRRSHKHKKKEKNKDKDRERDKDKDKERDKDKDKEKDKEKEKEAKKEKESKEKLSEEKTSDSVSTSQQNQNVTKGLHASASNAIGEQPPANATSSNASIATNTTCNIPTITLNSSSLSSFPTKSSKNKDKKSKEKSSGKEEKLKHKTNDMDINEPKAKHPKLSNSNSVSSTISLSTSSSSSSVSTGTGNPLSKPPNSTQTSATTGANSAIETSLNSNSAAGDSLTAATMKQVPPLLKDSVTKPSQQTSPIITHSDSSSSSFPDLPLPKQQSQSKAATSHERSKAISAPKAAPPPPPPSLANSASKEQSKNFKSTSKDKSLEKTPKDDEKEKKKRRNSQAVNTFIEPPAKQLKSKEQVKSIRDKSKSPSLRNCGTRASISADTSNTFLQPSVSPSSTAAAAPLPPPPSAPSAAHSPALNATEAVGNATSATANAATCNNNTAPSSTTNTTSMAAPHQLPVDYLHELQELHHKIMTLDNNNHLQQVVELIANTGCYELTTKTFDFDLCKLDRVTVQRLQEFFATSVS